MSKAAGYLAKCFAAASLKDLFQCIDNCKIIDFVKETLLYLTVVFTRVTLC